ncbi:MULTISPECIES: hypothetical protein [unclassified Pseudoalteromonas]|uniref:hypothetical protein n=1 Tax=unclassified Pseudoalteromonas TaxID=194690 RepID=UPI003863F8C7
MNRKEAMKILEDNIESMREQSEIHKKSEKALDKEHPKDSCVIGPKTEDDYQDMLNDIKESGEDK